MNKIDPFGSMQGFMNKFQQFMGNPMNLMSSNGIPQQYMKDPNETIQYLMNTGKISQAQYNNLNKLAKQIQNNPAFKQFIGGKNQM